MYTSASSISLEPWKDDGHLPLSLQNLEFLDFSTNALNTNDPATWKTLAQALQLPKIKKIILRNELGTQFDEMIRTWNNAIDRDEPEVVKTTLEGEEESPGVSSTKKSERKRTTRKTKVRTESLREIIFAQSTASMRVLNTELWPNLRR